MPHGNSKSARYATPVASVGSGGGPRRLPFDGLRPHPTGSDALRPDRQVNSSPCRGGSKLYRAPHGAARGCAEANMNRRLLDQNELARLLGVSGRTIESWRLRGCGPKFVAISRRCVRYRASDVEEWANQKLRASTSDAGGEPSVTLVTGRS
jgi:predicted DNA-binding transcriptional regulator AlpA